MLNSQLFKRIDTLKLMVGNQTRLELELKNSRDPAISAMLEDTLADVKKHINNHLMNLQLRCLKETDDV